MIGFCDPLGTPRAIAEHGRTEGVSLISMELIPRITRAQSMDALSSQANIGRLQGGGHGRRSLAEDFPDDDDRGGHDCRPAKVFVIGAGVAGLQAIATAKRLGAVVSAFDVRPAVKEQVQSVGGKFVELPLETAVARTRADMPRPASPDQQRKQAELMAKVIAESDVVITTAAVPGKPAPKLITAGAVERCSRAA